MFTISKSPLGISVYNLRDLVFRTPNQSILPLADDDINGDESDEAKLFLLRSILQGAYVETFTTAHVDGEHMVIDGAKRLTFLRDVFGSVPEYEEWFLDLEYGVIRHNLDDGAYRPPLTTTIATVEYLAQQRAIEDPQMLQFMEEAAQLTCGNARFTILELGHISNEQAVDAYRSINAARI